MIWSQVKEICAFGILKYYAQHAEQPVVAYCFYEECAQFSVKKSVLLDIMFLFLWMHNSYLPRNEEITHDKILL